MRFVPILICICVVLVTPVAFSQKSVQNEAPNVSPRLESSQETNDRIAELARAGSVKQADYVISSGDLLAVDVFDVTELSRDLRVDESGFIAIPLVSVKVRAAGLTPLQLQEKIAEVLQANGLVTNPSVTVSVKERHGEPITVAGAVRTPIVIQAVGPMTLLEVISQAGGISPDAGSEIIITRSASAAGPTEDTANGLMQSSTIKIDLNDLLYAGELKFNVPVIGGDVVTISHAGVVYAVGAVLHPGGFVMQSDSHQMTVLKVVSLSGGWIPTAKPNDAIILRREEGTGRQLKVPVDLKRILTLKTEDVTLQTNDILYVPDSTGKRAVRRTGEIAISLATGAALYRVSTGIP